VSIVLSTDGLQPGERESYWRHVMSDTFAPVSIREMAGDQVAGSIRGRWVGRMMVADVRSTGQDIRRTPRQIGEADNAYFQIAVAAGGIGRVSQDGRQAVLHPGDCAVYETTRPFHWLFDDRWNVWVFSLPSDSIRLTDAQRRSVSARRLEGATGLTGVVSRLLLDLARHSDELSAGQTRRALAQTGDLVLTLLADCLDDEAATGGAVRRSLMLRIKDHIDQRLTDPALSPAEIAAAVHISTRYLHKLFEAEHHTVSLYVRGLRLERAHRDLLDPRLSDRPVSAVARASGFGDLSGFNRTFKAAYGITPTELREQQGPDDARPSRWT
jgi:AraC-like DNA-binding protein